MFIFSEKINFSSAMFIFTDENDFSPVKMKIRRDPKNASANLGHRAPLEIWAIFYMSEKKWIKRDSMSLKIDFSKYRRVPVFATIWLILGSNTDTCRYLSDI